MDQFVYPLNVKCLSCSVLITFVWGPSEVIPVTGVICWFLPHNWLPYCWNQKKTGETLFWNFSIKILEMFMDLSNIMVQLWTDWTDLFFHCRIPANQAWILCCLRLNLVTRVTKGCHVVPTEERKWKPWYFIRCSCQV